MALFPFGKKDSDKPNAGKDGEREYFKPMAQQKSQGANDPQQKEVLRLIAIDACRKVDLDQQVRSCQVVGGERSAGYTLLLKFQEHVNLNEAQLIKRTQAFEKRCGVVAHSRNIPLLDVFWGMPASMLQMEQHTGSGNSSFAVSQMADFSASQLSAGGAGSAFYPDASLVPWSAEDLPETGEVRKAPKGPTAGLQNQQSRSKLGFGDN